MINLKKRLLTAALLITAALVFGSCTVKKLDGEDEINALKEECKTLSSGTYTVTDIMSGKETMFFSFCYPDNSKLAYIYVEDSNFTEYHDGEQLMLRMDRNEVAFAEGSEEWYLYTKEEPHPYAVGGLCFFLGNAAEKVETEQSDSGTTYRYRYNAEKMAKETGTQGLTEFYVEYRFGNDGSAEIIQHSTVETDGAQQEYAYSVSLTEKNAVTPDMLKAKYEG